MAWWCKDCGKMWGLRGWTVFLWCEECKLWQEVTGLSGEAGVEPEEVQGSYQGWVRRAGRCLRDIIWGSQHS